MFVTSNSCDNLNSVQKELPRIDTWLISARNMFLLPSARGSHVVKMASTQGGGIVSRSVCEDEFSYKCAREVL
jgi:hypothetical protein